MRIEIEIPIPVPPRLHPYPLLSHKLFQNYWIMSSHLSLRLLFPVLNLMRDFLRYISGSTESALKFVMHYCLSTTSTCISLAIFGYALDDERRWICERIKPKLLRKSNRFSNEIIGLKSRKNLLPELILYDREKINKSP